MKVYICENCKSFQFTNDICDNCNCTTLSKTDKTNGIFVKAPYIDIDIINFFNKYNDKDKRKIFTLICKEMQKQIIGYINIFGTFEPAVQKNKIFMPLSSFGVSNVTLDNTNHFIPFPDNKTLYDMLDEPDIFYKWCKSNNINY